MLQEYVRRARPGDGPTGKEIRRLCEAKGWGGTSGFAQLGALCWKRDGKQHGFFCEPAKRSQSYPGALHRGRHRAPTLRRAPTMRPVFLVGVELRRLGF